MPEAAGPRHLWLYRHGPLAVPSDLCVGWTDVPLADEPKTAREAAALGRHIGGTARVYASDLTRCMQTAAPLAAALQVPLTPARELREMNFGAWEGQAWSSLAERDPEVFQRFKDDWTHTAPEGGESFVDLVERVRGFWEAVAARHADETVVLVSHGVALAALTTLLLGWPPRHAMRHMLDRGKYGYLHRDRAAWAWNFDPALMLRNGQAPRPAHG